MRTYFLVYGSEFLFSEMINFPKFLVDTVVRPKMSAGLSMELLLVGHGLDDLCCEIKWEYVQYLRGDKTNKFSTKVDNNDNFGITRAILLAELDFFDYKARIIQIILDCPTRLVYYVLSSQLQLIFDEFESTYHRSSRLR